MEALTNGEIVEETTAIEKRSKTTGIVKAMEDLKQVRTFVAAELVDGTDYGPIPGTGKVKVKRDGKEVEVEKKVLLLSGAQKVGMFFNARPVYRISQTPGLTGGHVEYVVETALLSRATSKEIGAGVGSCSTMESKYRYRKAGRTCPACLHEGSIIKGQKEYGGGFVCWKKRDGCGAKFKDDDTAITGQPEGRVENEDIWDQRNTVLKMAKKRSLVDASIGLGCLADLFTQDLEEDVYDLPKDDPRPVVVKETLKNEYPLTPSQKPAHVVDISTSVPSDPEGLTPTGEQKLCHACEVEAKAGTGDGDVYFEDECTKHTVKAPEVKTRNFKFMEAMKKQKARVGDAAYYKVLGGAGYEHCAEITDRAVQKLAYGLLLELPATALEAGEEPW